MEEGYGQERLASEAGYKSSSSIANIFANKRGLLTDNLVKLVGVMGYDVVVRKGEKEFVLK